MASKECISCHVVKTASEFRLRTKDSSGGKKGELTAKCGVCMDRDRAKEAERQRKKRRRDSESLMESDNALSSLPSTVPLLDFLERAKSDMELPDCHIRCLVDTKQVEAGTELSSPLKTRAGRIAELIGTKIMIHWTSVNSQNLCTSFK